MTKDLEPHFPVPAGALSPASVPAAEVRDMRFRWPGGRFDLRVDSFKVEAGERVFISGPSGCGKSTFLSLVAGILVPDSGEVLLAGRSLKGLRGSRRDRLRGDLIGFIFQQFNLVPYLGVLENVLLPAKFSPLRNARAAEAYGSPAAAAGELCRRLGLDDGVMGRPVSRLSVGQQQRVAAARALLGRPPLLVADEPTSSLDDDLRLAFLKLLAGECRQAGSALLFVSHDRSLAGEFDREERLDKLNAGRVV
ncbi:MAG: ABC transporter ATP-binding protein [Deltaproteobacteria bacterium]|jgi:putative ABC transport system ATP-binding protein|nr:ABC transporter ATP-binding protein [Deltaproteobacteria bacterium]